MAVTRLSILTGNRCLPLPTSSRAQQFSTERLTLVCTLWRKRFHWSLASVVVTGNSRRGKMALRYLEVSALERGSAAGILCGRLPPVSASAGNNIRDAHRDIWAVSISYPLSTTSKYLSLGLRGVLHVTLEAIFSHCLELDS